MLVIAILEAIGRGRVDVWMDWMDGGELADDGLDVTGHDQMYACMYVCMYVCMYGWMDATGGNGLDGISRDRIDR